MNTPSPLSNLRVQIQTQSGCDGRCVFCPNAEVAKSNLPQGRMDPALFHKIVDELAELRPRRISPYLMNEPLLDARLPELIRYISDTIPGTTTLVTSNGTRLDVELGSRLAEAGLKRIKVSLQSLDARRNAELMGGACDSARVTANIVAFKQYLDRERIRSVDLRISMIVTRTNQDEIDAARKFWRRQGIRLVTSALENRGGNIAAAGELNPGEMAPLNGNCARPTRDLCILWNGDVVLCCVDWWRTVVLGNVGQQSIRDIWTGPKVTALREALRTNDTSALPKICVHCAQSAQPNAHRKGIGARLRRLLTSARVH